MTRKVRTSTLVDFARGKLSPKDSLKVLDDIESSKGNSTELEVITAVINVSAEHGDFLYSRDTDAREREGRMERLFSRLLPQRGRVSPAFAIGGAFVVMLGVLIGIRVSTSEYYALAETEDLKIESVVRGPGAEDFEVARQRIERNDLAGAIRVLERYARAFPQGIGTDYAHYCAGALYLKMARRTIVPLLSRFDAGDVKLALAHLTVAVQETQNALLAENAHILQAKAFIMINDPDAAIKELNEALKYKGPRESEIRKLIQALTDR